MSLAVAYDLLETEKELEKTRATLVWIVERLKTSTPISLHHRHGRSFFVDVRTGQEIAVPLHVID